jgi:hypothetical protein
VATGDVLKMLDERIVYGSTTKSPNDGERLRCHLLGYPQAEACRDLSDELEKNWRSFLDESPFGNETGGFGHRLGEHARTAKYPLSDASADPERPPNAKTSTQERMDSGSDKFSPSLWAMSAIDLNIMTVEIGNSTGSAASPNVPPAAPEAVARARWKNCEPVRGAFGRVRNATFSAASSPFEVADAIALDANAGSA